MKKLYRRLLLPGIFILLVTGGCNSDSGQSNHNPTNPSDTVIIVDKHNPNAVRPPCGTEDAVCGTVTDGILSAARLGVGIPTILIKSGIYDAEPHYPVQIPMAVNIEAERAGEATISGPSRSSLIFETLSLSASNITLKDIKIVSETERIINVVGENVLLKGLIVEGGPYSEVGIYVEGTVSVQNSQTTAGIEIDKKGIAIIEECELDDGAYSAGYLTLKNSVIHEGLSASSGKTVIKNSTLYDGVYQYEAQIELSDTIIYGDIETWEGEAVFKNNRIEGQLYLVRARVTLEGNTIFWTPEDKTDLSDEGAIYGGGSETFVKLIDNTVVSEGVVLQLINNARASISRNRFDSTMERFVISCEEGVSIKSDGTNKLLNPERQVGCGDLPEFPGTEFF